MPGQQLKSRRSSSLNVDSLIISLSNPLKAQIHAGLRPGLLFLNQRSCIQCSLCERLLRPEAEMKTLSSFSQHLHKSTFLCLCTKRHPLYKKGACLLTPTIQTAMIKRSFCKRKCFGMYSLVALFSPGL